MRSEEFQKSKLHIFSFRTKLSLYTVLQVKLCLIIQTAENLLKFFDIKHMGICYMQIPLKIRYIKLNKCFIDLRIRSKLKQFSFFNYFLT